MKLNSYLSLGGRCAEAFEYYRQHLGATNIVVMSFRGTPAEEQTPEEWRDKVMHGSVMIGNQILMGSDGMPGQPHEGTRDCSMALEVESPEEAERVFAALTDGGQITQALAPTFFALKFGMAVDKFKVSWMVICEAPQ